MLLKTIDRTAIAAWCPSHQHSYLATGTAAGALDASFSNTSNLELYQLDGPVAPSGGDASAAPFPFGDAAPAGGTCQPLASLTSAQRFSNLLWSVGIKDRSQGILAGGMENGELILWDAQRILEQQEADSCVVFRNTNHSGGIAGMDFNNQQKHVLATGASGGEIFIWDLETPAKPYSPGPRSAKLEDITSLAWNNQVTHILASASTTGYTVIWDLKNRREVMSLNYAGNLQMPGMHNMASNRRGVTAVAWNPDNATQLVTATEDDNNPVIMMWDLRNAHAPERIFSGHSKGILSLSWCKMDADLLFSSGKDNRTICWNPTTGDVVGELPISHNWVFDVRVNQSNPNLLSTASFDSKVNVYSLQSTNEGEEVVNAPANAQDDPFSAAIYSASATASFSLKQPPKWFRRPVGATFGFGNRLVSFAQPPASAQATAASLGTPMAYPVSTHPVVTDRHLIHQTHELEAALDANHVAEFCDKRIQTATNDVEIKSWQVLKLLFETDARDKLVHFLGYDKDELKARVAQFLRDHPAHVPASTDASVDPESVRENLGSLNIQPQDDGTAPVQGDDEGANPFADSNQEEEGDPDAAFFAQPSVPLTSTDATATTSAAGPALQPFLSTPLSLHLENANGPDGLVTKAVLMGDFDHAVDLCLADERYADALILASCGGTDLLARTQQRYFGLKAQNAPYLRLLHGIVSGDLSDVVDHIDIRDWDQVLVLLCTYAQGEQFSSLCDKLGARLEAKWHTQSPGNSNSQLLQSAVVCYLAAGSLDSVVKIWLYLQQVWVQDEVAQGAVNSADNPTVMAESLQHLIEKVSVFRKAVDYIDTAVETPLGSAVQTQTDGPSAGSRRKFALSSLYDLYCDYAQWLIAQGQPETAAKFLKRTPEEYFRANVSGDNIVSILKDRLFHSGLANESTLAPSFPFTPVYVGTDGDMGQETASAPTAGHFAATAAPQPSTTAAYGPPSSYQGYPSTATSQPAGAHGYASQAPASHYQTPAPTTTGQPFGGYGASGYDSSYHHAPPAQSGYPATPYQTA
ncbi:protein transport protein S31, partial [Dimargaris xerosporica]